MKVARNQWDDDGRWFVTNREPIHHLLREALTAHFNHLYPATGCVVELLGAIQAAARDTAVYKATVFVGRHGDQPKVINIEGVLVFSTHLVKHPKDFGLLVETTMTVHYEETE